MKKHITECLVTLVLFLAGVTLLVLVLAGTVQGRTANRSVITGPCATDVYRWAKYHNRVVADAKQWCGSVSREYLRVVLFELFKDGSWHPVAAGPITSSPGGRWEYAGARSPTCRVGTRHYWSAHAERAYVKNSIRVFLRPVITSFHENCG